MELADNIRNKFREDVLQDEYIAIDALYQITHEALRRLAAEKAFSLKVIRNG